MVVKIAISWRVSWSRSASSAVARQLLSLSSSSQEPGFFDLLQAIAGPGKKLGFGAAARRCAIIRAHGSSRPQALPAQNSSCRIRFRQRGINSDEAQRKGLGSQFQIRRSLIHFIRLPFPVFSRQLLVQALLTLPTSPRKRANSAAARR